MCLCVFVCINCLASTQPGHARNTSIGNVKSGVMNERREHMDFLYSVRNATRWICIISMSSKILLLHFLKKLVEPYAFLFLPFLYLPKENMHANITVQYAATLFPHF